jgi:hypothetical protein
MTRPVTINLHVRDYQLLYEAGQIDGTLVDDAATELFNQGFRSVKRRLDALSMAI